MSNMSYCRWENTAADMADCTSNQADLQERWDDENDAPSQYEKDGYFRALRQAAKMLEQATPEELAEAGVDLARLA